jgi:hypothetical protein
MVAVLVTTRDAVEPGEFDDVLAQLGPRVRRAGRVRTAGGSAEVGARLPRAIGAIDATKRNAVIYRAPHLAESGNGRRVGCRSPAPATVAAAGRQFGE